MGYGDNVMATGMARGAADRGKRVALGDQAERRIRWDHNSELIFRHNPNLAPAKSQDDPDLEWIKYYKGHRLYNAPDHAQQKWRWRSSWGGAPQGEMYFTDEELRSAENFGSDYVVVEPNVPNWKTVAPNKQWPASRFEEVAEEVRSWGRTVVQLQYGEKHTLRAAWQARTTNYRWAVLVLSRAAYALLPEGGLHHGAAAQVRTVGGSLVRDHVPAVVLFGGFIPIRTTGYSFHANLGSASEGCGSFRPCAHCAKAMEEITADQVIRELKKIEGKWTRTGTASSAASQATTTTASTA